MKLSPLDIQHMEFDTGVSGYRRRQVREFLERMSEEREDLLRELQALRDELSDKNRRIQELQAGDAELKRAVIAAERIANELTENARREAELIKREAERERAAMLQEAESRLGDARAELKRLEREEILFREQFRGLLRSYARSLERSAGDGANPDGESGGARKAASADSEGAS